VPKIPEAKICKRTIFEREFLRIIILKDIETEKQ